MKIGVQLYTVRDYLGSEKSVAETFVKLKQIGYDNIQSFGMLPGTSYKRFAELAEQNGLEICGSFEDFDAMAYQSKEVANAVSPLKTHIVGTAFSLPPQDDNPKDVLDRINLAAENMSKYGYKFSYHNHEHEFSRWKDGSIFDYYIENTPRDKVTFCFDTFWAQYGGADVRHYIKKLEGRLDIIHLKDYALHGRQPRFAAVGDGNMYWDGIIDAAKESGTEFFVVEQDVCYGESPFEALKRSREFLEKYNK